MSGPTILSAEARSGRRSSRSNWKHSSVFFFSCRTRHTTFSRDWSSDVCSSDLIPRGHQPAELRQAVRPRLPGNPGLEQDRPQIGRASCREREKNSAVGVSPNKEETVKYDSRQDYCRVGEVEPAHQHTSEVPRGV